MNVFLLAFCVAASVSKTFASAVNSDSVWEKFLLPEYSSLIHSSKKVFHSAVCNDYVLIEDGKMSLCIDKATGKRSIMLSGKELELSWGHNPRFWQFISIPDSRFEKVPKLVFGCPFKIDGVIEARLLSPGTRYSAYVVYKAKDNIPDFREDIGVGVIDYGPQSENQARTQLTKLEKREDGWMEVKSGEFLNERGLMDSDEIYFRIREIKYTYWKPGFIIEGIEFRPVKRLY
jgi:hypothetical protein